MMQPWGKAVVEESVLPAFIETQRADKMSPAGWGRKRAFCSTA